MRYGILDAFSHPLRLDLIRLLSGRSRNVSELMEMCRRPQSVISQHLAILRKSRLVETRRNGKEIYYRLSSTRTARVEQTLSRFIQSYSP